MNDTVDPELRDYLRRLGWALEALRPEDRAAIVDEVREHVLARRDQGVAVTEALAGFGPPEAYARGFIDEMEISGALASQRPLTVLAVVAGRMHRSLTAAVAFLGVLFLAGVAFLGAVVAAMKPFHPDNVGLWISPRGDFFLGFLEPRGGQHEVLGAWLYPLAVLNLALAWFVGRLILLWAVRSLPRAR